MLTIENSSTLQHSACQGCETSLQQPMYCHSCHKLQQLKAGVNYFEIFSHPISYTIDQQQIEDSYDELLLTLHPDYYAQSEAREQVLSMEHTTLLNAAKEVLFNPFERGKYLLSQFAPLEGNLTANPPQSFIMDMFTLQEELDQLESGQGDLHGTAQTIHALMDETDQTLTEYFSALPQAGEAKDMIYSIKEQLGKIKFLLNLESRLQQLQKIGCRSAVGS